MPWCDVFRVISLVLFYGFYRSGRIVCKSLWCLWFCGISVSGRDFPTWGRDFPTWGRDFPTWGRDFPTWGRDFPTWGRDFPTWGRDFPTWGRDFPTWGRDFPTWGRDFPTWGRDFPMWRRGNPVPQCHETRTDQRWRGSAKRDAGSCGRRSSRARRMPAPI